MPQIMPLLALCDATIDLHLFVGSSTLLPLLGALPLQRLSARLAELFPDLSGLDFAHPLFTKITHLDLHDFPAGSWDTWSGLAQLPALTLRDYLRVSSMPGYATVAIDPRFVVLLVPDLFEDWEVGARGGADRWVRASELVRKRRSGEVKVHHDLKPKIIRHNDHEVDEEDEIPVSLLWSGNAQLMSTHTWTIPDDFVFLHRSQRINSRLYNPHAINHRNGTKDTRSKSTTSVENQNKEDRR
ncbi:hypothetical protein C8R44DRAFT_725425 [Mycena epipterygia]|nr:hypothetical protein C8R44DRAFT_725425 [Mycena epipterygia]